ncbi:MAG: cell division protein FtsZ [Prolixibacteraceae bacterium]|jgi:cell division protein FtsZ|nr:cell division protein FtsZ [Prolixibacteraceae bacterium]MBT6764433.1 cell division protein FtsZ [Prolixibacteraceae bacterium]MBT6997472.1 cell division protein FtsZ [Prolixibacteraceae bacterium]MBT7395584.1 cell division protein FtsZ [Prolixibacteraceae bacterium]
MTDKIANFTFPEKSTSEIKVVGVGGGGGNAVNHMFKEGIRDVDFIICNTDSQALETSLVQSRVQLGASLTEGRGAGNKPEVGKQAALENIDDVKHSLSGNTKMVFITAGMGGGTGTGGAPVIAETCKELGFLTVGIVTVPFRNEGRRRINQAIEGIAKLETHVDSLLVINNERIREMYGDFGISEAFAKADNIIATAARGIAEIITVPGYINVDFADVETVMRKSGLAIMGTGIAEGENRAEDAVEKALNSPLLNNNDIRGAKNILLNITSGNQEVTMDEVGRVTDFVQNKAGFDADLIWGNGKDESLGENISVTVIATGFSSRSFLKNMDAKNTNKKTHHLLVNTIPTENQSEKKILDKKQAVPGGQKTIEFTISEDKKEENDDFKSMYPRTSKERNNLGDKNIKIDSTSMSDEDVDEMENIPAYKRRHLRMNDPRYKKEVSKYSVNSSNKISDRNSFFYDNVD